MRAISTPANSHSLANGNAQQDNDELLSGSQCLIKHKLLASLSYVRCPC